MNRWFNNMDMRLTNTSIENVSLTGYGKIYNEARSIAEPGDGDGREPGTVATACDNTRADQRPVRRSTHPIDYHKSTAGLKGVWRPGAAASPGRAGDRRRLRVRRPRTGKRDLSTPTTAPVSTRPVANDHQ